MKIWGFLPGTIYKEIVQIEPENSAAYYSLGLALHAQNRLEGAVQAYRTAIQLEPDNAGMHHNLAGALYDLGKPDEAIAAYRTAIRLRPNPNFTYPNNSEAGSKLPDLLQNRTPR